MTITATAPTRGPLDGIVVLDLSRALAGPQATMMLGDLGARVIKLESREGDDSRHWGPPFVGDDQISTYFLSCNRNKESVTIDLKSDEGRDLLERLARRADVLVENFRPGVLERLGFGPKELHELNPGLVICSISGFGHDGPEAQRGGFDQIAQGEAGLMSVTGHSADDPLRVGVPIADLLAGMNSAFGIMSALWERARTGLGRVVRVSLLSSLVGIHSFQGTRFTIAGQVPEPQGNHHPSISPYGLFDAADGPLQIACGNEGIWAALCGVLGLDPRDARYSSNSDRVAHREQLTADINRTLRSADRASWLAALSARGVPAGKVRTLEEVYNWEQTHSQGLIIDVEHSSLGSLRLPGPAIRFDDQQFAGGRRKHLAPPGLGEHNDSVLAWLLDAERARN